MLIRGRCLLEGCTYSDLNVISVSLLEGKHAFDALHLLHKIQYLQLTVFHIFKSINFIEFHYYIEKTCRKKIITVTIKDLIEYQHVH